VSVAFAPEAVEDLAAAVEYLRERNPRAAAATADAVFAASTGWPRTSSKVLKASYALLANEFPAGQFVRTGSITAEMARI
jgi:hypothetical protein